MSDGRSVFAGVSYRQACKELDRARRHWPAELIPVPKPWPGTQTLAPRIEVWRSREYLVQAFQEPGGIIRLSVNRTYVQRDGRWRDGIAWDELQAIKAQCGYGDREAVEIYPPDSDLVCDGNLRHLWVLPDRLPFSWKRGT